MIGPAIFSATETTAPPILPAVTTGMAPGFAWENRPEDDIQHRKWSARQSEMKAKLYLETTIPSYLVGRPSRDLLVAAHQEITRHWWESRRSDFELTSLNWWCRRYEPATPFSLLSVRNFFGTFRY